MVLPQKLYDDVVLCEGFDYAFFNKCLSQIGKGDVPTCAKCRRVCTGFMEMNCNRRLVDIYRQAVILFRKTLLAKKPKGEETK